MLPSGYTQVDYIYSPGQGPYIDIDVTGDEVAHYEMNIKITTVSRSWARYFGGIDLPEYPVISSNQGSTGNQQLHICSYNQSTRETSTYHTFYPSNNWNKLEVNGGTVVFNGTTITTSARNISYGTSSFNLFSTQWYGGGAACYIGRVKLWKGSTLFRDLYPAVRTSDSAYGFYDVISDTFYTNNGSGTLTAGPESTEGYLCFTANEAGSTIKLERLGSPSWGGFYRRYGETWTAYPSSGYVIITLTNAGDKVYYKGTLSGNQGFGNCMHFVMTGSIAASGNIMSFVYGDTYNLYTATPNYSFAFYYLFYGCTSLTTPPELPATTLTKNGVYEHLFSGCTNLQYAPELPATEILGDSCYPNMFNGCTSITSSPELPATTLTPYCYANMFKGCTALTIPPNLPATTLANNCYQGMFYGCTSLTKVPTISATTVAAYCCFDMFNGCSSLTYPCELLATSLAQQCYQGMFYGCTAMKVYSSSTTGYTKQWRIPNTGTGTLGTGSLNYMFTDTSGTVTGTPSINTTYYIKNNATLIATYNGSTIINQEVSDDVAITYNGGTLATITSGTKTLNCANKVAATNIGIGNKTLNCANKLMATNVVVTVS